MDYKLILKAISIVIAAFALHTNIMVQIDGKISNIEGRAEKREELLERRLARMETILMEVRQWARNR